MVAAAAVDGTCTVLLPAPCGESTTGVPALGGAGDADNVTGIDTDGGGLLLTVAAAAAAATVTGC